MMSDERAGNEQQSAHSAASESQIALPVIVGLLGGVASGKSLVARMLESLGAARLDADRVGHEVLLDPEVKSALRARWGDGVFNALGDVDRSAVAKIVFSRNEKGRRELAFLESVTHPRIGARLRDEAMRQGAAGRRILVLDAPVMLKAGWDSLCRAILYVDAPAELRLQRALLRGWTPEEFAARESAQESTETKRSRADFVIDNGGLPEATAAQVKAWWQEFARLVE